MAMVHGKILEEFRSSPQINARVTAYTFSKLQMYFRAFQHRLCKLIWFEIVGLGKELYLELKNQVRTKFATYAVQN